MVKKGFRIIVIILSFIFAVGCKNPNGGGQNDTQEANTNTISSVTISGTAKVGQTLTATAKDSNGATVDDATFQWKSSDTSEGAYNDISSATANTYKLASSDEGKYIKVDALNAATSSAVLSSATGAILASNITQSIIQLSGFSSYSGDYISFGVFTSASGGSLIAISNGRVLINTDGSVNIPLVSNGSYDAWEGSGNYYVITTISILATGSYEEFVGTITSKNIVNGYNTVSFDDLTPQIKTIRITGLSSYTNDYVSAGLGIGSTTVAIAYPTVKIPSSGIVDLPQLDISDNYTGWLTGGIYNIALLILKADNATKLWNGVKSSVSLSSQITTIPFSGFSTLSLSVLEMPDTLQSNILKTANRAENLPVRSVAIKDAGESVIEHMTLSYNRLQK
jgi:hypothetical protein